MKRPRLRVIQGGRAATGPSPVAETLEHYTADERTMLALVLIERLTQAEAAVAMGMSVRRFERSYQALIARLKLAARPRAQVAPRVSLRLRKAS